MSTNFVAISGEIGEYADFSPLDRSAGQTLYVDFVNVILLNSLGLQTWI
ncbi:MAG: hypothetical protein H7318_01405 [Oligoflexus sp.]|nr:hypothetical protein [Oligoflexus sp.]